MKTLTLIVQVVWTACLLTIGLVVGAGVGFANGGWIGAVCLGAVGLFIGAFIAAAGKAGVELLLQIVR